MQDDGFVHISEIVPERSAGATHRYISALYVALAPLPGEDPRSSRALYINLDRSGMPLKPLGNGRPRPPARRTFDLRVGDEMLCGCRWRVIRSIGARGSKWLSDDVVANLSDDGDGYVYRLTS